MFSFFLSFFHSFVVCESTAHARHLLFWRTALSGKDAGNAAIQRTGDQITTTVASRLKSDCATP